jgi:hypothetical protein
MLFAFARALLCYHKAHRWQNRAPRSLSVDLPSRSSYSCSAEYTLRRAIEVRVRRLMTAKQFCSSCGERLKKDAGSLPFTSVCARCSPRASQARMKLIAAAALCIAIGFVLGHYTSPREPFYYIGTPLELGATDIGISTTDSGLPASSTSPARVQQPTLSAAEGICGARTRSGKPCRRKVKGGGYCWQHRNKMTQKKPSVSIR